MIGKGSEGHGRASGKTRREAMAGLLFASGAIMSASPARALQLAARRPVFSPEEFGARGDGVSDDYEAFLRMAAAVNRARTGRIRLAAGKAYFLNRNRVTGGRGRNGIVNIRFEGCNGLDIDLNGSTIAVKGNFHRGGDNGRSRSFSDAVIPLLLSECTDVRIHHGTLAGNVDRMTRAPDVVESDNHGLALYACRNVRIEDLRIHHFASDGVYIAADQFGPNTRPCENVRLERVVCANNGRQGLSNVGGAGVIAVDCQFRETGRTGGRYGYHSPAAGVAIEPTGLGHRIRSDFRAERCQFVDNIGSPVGGIDPDLVSAITLIGCSGSSREMTRLILAPEAALVDGGSWTNVQIACAYAAYGPYRRPIRIEVRNGRWSGDDPDWEPVYDLNTAVAPSVSLHHNQFRLLSRRPFTSSYLFRCANPDHAFENNSIFVSGSGHDRSDLDLVGDFVGTGRVRYNRWETDLPAPFMFRNNYQTARVVEGEVYVGRIGPF